MSRIKKRAKWGVGLFLVSFVGLGMIGLIPGPDFVKATLLQLSMPTRGSSQEAIIGQLNALRIEHSGRDENGYIHASMPDYTWGFVIRSHMDVVFNVNYQGKLGDYSVRMSGTGP